MIIEDAPLWLMEEIGKNPIKYDDPLTSLGQIVYCFQQFENCFYDLLGYLLSKEDECLRDILSAEIAFKNIIKICDSLLRLKVGDEKIIEEYSEIVKIANVIEQERNTYIHSIYDIEQWDDEKIIYSRTKKRNHNGIKSSVEIIKNHDNFIKTISKIDNGIKMINALIEKIGRRQNEK